MTLYVPLRFWFCKNPGLYLPLLALQYHPIRIILKLRPLNEMFIIDNPSSTDPCDITASQASITSMNLYGDFIHLDTEERRRFVANAHDYLIEQVQYTNSLSIDATATTVQLPLEFNHPLREMYWIVQRDAAVNAHQWFNYSNLAIDESSSSQNSLQNLISTALIKVEGFDRFDIRNADYFRFVQPFQYHTVIPFDDFVYSYSFCFRPEDMQPSGSMNASRIDTITLQLQMNNMVSPARGKSNARIYGINHNVLRIVDGFGGLLFRI